MHSSTISPPIASSLSIVFATITSVTSFLLVSSFLKKKRSHDNSTQPSNDDINTSRTTNGGYESLIGNTPLVYLPQISKLIPNNHERKIKLYVKMESLNPGGTGKDRAAQSMIMDAEQRGDLPPPLNNENSGDTMSGNINNRGSGSMKRKGKSSPSSQPPNNVPKNINTAIQIAIQKTRTNGILIEGTSGSTGISLASISCSHGHGVIVVMPDDQSSQKVEYLQRLGVGVVIVQNCSISNPHHYVNTANMIYEMIEVDRRYDRYYWDNIVKSNGDTNSNEGDTPPRILKAAFMNQFENLANVKSHYTTTGPEIYKQLNGKVDAFVMSAGTGGTLVGVGAYLKEQWFNDEQQKKKQQRPPRIVLVDPPGSSLYNKIKYGVAYTKQQSEQRLRRHRYDTLAEGIGLDRITANFALGCEGYNGSSSFGNRIDTMLNNCRSTATITQSTSNQTTRQSKIIDDAYSITDQQAIYMAHYLLRHEGLFVGSSTAMNIVGALTLAIQGDMPEGSNIVTVVCDGGYRHTSRFWNRKFVEEEWGLVWPGDGCCDENGNDNILDLLGINDANT